MLNKSHIYKNINDGRKKVNGKKKKGQSRKGGPKH